ncbi:MAG: hypothetical protein KFW07_02820, partial [Mycoplasmataceae bacterium]|nr:hypothetical protein [Mycoplasmataceae bacterium]
MNTNIKANLGYFDKLSLNKNNDEIEILTRLKNFYKNNYKKTGLKVANFDVWISKSIIDSKIKTYTQ